MKNRYLVGLLLVLSLASLFIGVSSLELKNLVEVGTLGRLVFFQSRLPRLVSILIAGMGMSVAGLIMQQIAHNKFISPTTATTVDSAKLGVLVAMIFLNQASSLTRMVFAFGFALVGSFLFMRVLARIKMKNAVFIPLIGMMLGGVIDSITTFFAYRYDLIQSLDISMQGDFSMLIKGRYELLYLSIPLLIISYLYANKFSLAGMGEEFSTNLGLDYRLVVNLGVVLVSLISSIVLIIVGKIPFLGLVVPNIVSLINGDNLKKNLPPTVLFGAIFLLGADILGRLIIFPYELSISLTVGVLGSIIFLYLVVKEA